METTNGHVKLDQLPAGRYTRRLLAALNRELPVNERQAGPDTGIRAVCACRKALDKLRKAMSDLVFSDTAAEIAFFKEVKPLLYSKFIYYVQLYNYRIKMPPGGEAARRSYIGEKLRGIHRFFEDNLYFYQYFRAGSDYLDERYYTRAGAASPVDLQDFAISDQFSTSHDYKLSKIIANEMFQDFLENELLRLDTGVAFQAGQKLFPFAHPAWTASQTDLVELVYALKSSGAVNHGQIEINELIAVFAFVFQAEVHETYHKLLDISRRKKDMFVFLTRLKNSFANFLNDKLA
ncbi:RteC domain-containing protein [Mucilaginibacter sp. KACC 22773]|uniref:RteC domain-containing protein n=1 Tax=Mucilaginibacter sp. KACC 22773 TaxID=3025671 RepID=UPI00236536D6|nr:RteC domain-containing protein [Mucilaginibacter sp. KACC 22773]WDF81182.1 RteC domain-containing protein [Mucilaginibacter sp. KACC 22773]